MIALLLSVATSCASQVPNPQSAAPVAAADLFPEPKSGISIRVTPGEEMKLDALLAEFSKVTGLHLVIAKEDSMIVRATSTGLMGSVDVPAGEVYPWVESLLVHNGVVLAPMTDREPRLVSVSTLMSGAQRGGSLRNSAIFVPAEEIAAYSRHPAVLVTTVMNLPSVDVRTLSNSMRTMFTDANTQQIIPVGNSNSLIMTGFGSSVASMVTMLNRIEVEARRELEAAEKKAKDRPASPAPVEAPR